MLNVHVFKQHIYQNKILETGNLKDMSIAVKAIFSGRHLFAKPILVSNKTRHMIPANTARAIQTTHSVDQKFAIEP